MLAVECLWFVEVRDSEVTGHNWNTYHSWLLIRAILSTGPASFALLSPSTQPFPFSNIAVETNLTLTAVISADLWEKSYEICQQRHVNIIHPN